MAYRNLEKVRVMLKEATNLDLAYAFDDLVFPEHAAFMLQFNNNDDEDFVCYFHQDCLMAARSDFFANLSSTFQRHGSTISKKGDFVMNQKGAEIEIAFL